MAFWAGFQECHVEVGNALDLAWPLIRPKSFSSFEFEGQNDL